MTEPTDEIPEFIAEKLRSYSDDQLDRITDLLLSGSTPSVSGLPEDLKPIVIMQDETTVRAIGETAEGMTKSDGDDRAELTGYEGMAQGIIDHAGEVLGQEVAVPMAQEVPALGVDDDGRVEGIDGSGQIVVEQLADRYIGYAGPQVKTAFADIANEYAVENPVNLNMNPFG